jgi:hypothetical protein
LEEVVPNYTIKNTLESFIMGVKFADWWDERPFRTTPTVAHKGTSLGIMLTAWWLWKQRNTVIFDGAWPDLGGLLDTINAEAKSWSAAGASGLAALLPPPA